MNHEDAAALAHASQAGPINSDRIAVVARLSTRTREWFAVSRGAYLSLWADYRKLQRDMDEMKAGR